MTPCDRYLTATLTDFRCDGKSAEMIFGMLVLYIHVIKKKRYEISEVKTLCDSSAQRAIAYRLNTSGLATRSYDCAYN